jgi:nucleotide-binding universal stress UspA family protein
LAGKTNANLKVVIAQKPLPSCFSFAVSAHFVVDWKSEQREKCLAAQAQAKTEMTAAGIFPDVEVITGDEVQTILNHTSRLQADLLEIGTNRGSLIADRKTHSLTDRCTCAVLVVP